MKLRNRRILQRLIATACFVVLVLVWAAGHREPRLGRMFSREAGKAERPADARMAIVTTILSPDPSFPVWLEYHLRRVDCILLFLDDPSKTAIFEELVGDRRVVLFNGSTAQADMTPESRLIWRQDENNDVAIQFAQANHIDWLLHLDVDELFHDQHNSTWQTLPDVGMVRFYNVEAVFLPYEIDNYFDDCRLFKPHDGDLPYSAYVYGKSAVRVTPNVRSDGPHEFAGYDGKDIIVRNPVILHYPTPTYERWVAKYRHYGNFSDYWFDNPDMPLIPFMMESRDVIRSAFMSGDWEEAREYYISWIPDAASVLGYLESGDLVRFSPLNSM